MNWLAVLPRLTLGVAIMGALFVLVHCTIAQSSFALALPWYCFGFAEPPPSDLTQMILIPEWYALPTYGMLRAIDFGIGPLDSKVLGVAVAVAAFVAPLVLCFHDWSRMAPRAALSLLSVPLILIGIGWQAASSSSVMNPLPVQLLTLSYFLVFLVAFPLLARRRA
jgi:quinol-cytochrome oxidoreductase complex cytochrome b subunit